MVITLAGDVAQSRHTATSVTIIGFIDPSKPASKNGDPDRVRMVIVGGPTIDSTATPSTPVRQIAFNAFLDSTAAPKSNKVGSGTFTWPASGPVSNGTLVGDDVSMSKYFQREEDRISFFAPLTTSQPNIYATLFSSSLTPPPPEAAPISELTIDSIAWGLRLLSILACRGALQAPSVLTGAACVVSVAGSVTVPRILNKINEVAAKIKKSGTRAPSGGTPAPQPPAVTPTAPQPNQPPPGPIWTQCYSSITCPPGWECVNGQCVYVGPIDGSQGIDLP